MTQAPLPEIGEKLIEGKRVEVVKLVRQALKKGISAQQILDQGLLSGMTIVGKRFKKHEIFIPEVLGSARAMQEGVKLLEPLFRKEKRQAVAKAVIGTVQGDIHDIGKNLVGIMLKGIGFEVVDIGKDTAPQTFYETVVKEKPQLLCMSAMLTTTMVEMPKIITFLKRKKVRKSLKILVGGAPLSPSYAKKIGADGYGRDAVQGAELAQKIVKLS